MQLEKIESKKLAEDKDRQNRLASDKKLAKHSILALIPSFEEMENKEMKEFVEDYKEAIHKVNMEFLGRIQNI